MYLTREATESSSLRIKGLRAAVPAVHRLEYLCQQEADERGLVVSVARDQRRVGRLGELSADLLRILAREALQLTFDML